MDAADPCDFMCKKEFLLESTFLAISGLNKTVEFEGGEDENDEDEDEDDVDDDEDDVDSTWMFEDPFAGEEGANCALTTF